MELYDINMYEPSTYDKQDFVELRIGPCIGTSRKKCASSSKIRTKFEKHKIGLAVTKYDQMGNLYWEWIDLPEMGTAVTLYIRETTVTESTFSNILKRLYTSEEDSTIEKRQYVSKIVTEH